MPIWCIRLRNSATTTIPASLGFNRFLSEPKNVCGVVSRREALRRLVPELWRFAEPIGACPVVPSWSPELSGFAETHCVETLEYLEPPRGAIGRGLRLLVARQPSAGFATCAAVLAASRLRPIVPILPVVVERDGGRAVVIPEDAGYPTTEERIGELRG